MTKIGDYQYEIEIERKYRGWGSAQFVTNVRLMRADKSVFQHTDFVWRYVDSDLHISYTYRRAIKKALRQVEKFHKQYKNNSKFRVFLKVEGTYEGVREALSDE